MHIQLPAILKCTYCGAEGLRLAEGATVVTLKGIETVVTGAVKCPRCGSSYPVEDGIINFLPVRAGNIGPGQWTNHNRLVAWGYERFWRLGALSKLGGRDWPPAEELETIVRMLEGPSPQNLTTHNEIVFYLDEGCSTAFYGRAMARAIAEGRLETGSHEGHVVALDNSWPMLQEARQFIEREGLSAGLSLVRADVEKMPFIDGAFAGTANGGSLNEFRHTAQALSETRRTLASQGRAAFMVQMHARKGPGSALQDLLHLASGLHFFRPDLLKDFYQKAQFKLEEQQGSGLITISRLLKA